MADLKKVACDAIEKYASELYKLSEDIWSHPELALEETHAHETLTSFLEQQGFQVERSYKQKTAFKATYGSNKSPNICVVSEYDALPEIGHACGHNLIAEVGVAAGIGIKAAIAVTNDALGKVTVLGTPAEETHGGKIDLINAGAFSDVDVAMMAHPNAENDPCPIMLAVEGLLVTYVGRPAHAAGLPWDGVNALDAVFLCYQSISCMRQQMKPDWRVHCIVKEGGIKTNIIPERTSLEVCIRAPSDTELSILKEKIVNCFKGASMATGCQMSYEVVEVRYSSMLHNKPLLCLYETNLAALSTEDVPTVRSAVSGSTDMGNVAHVVPSIHPEFYIGGPGSCHTREFTKSTGDQKAQKYTLLQAKVLAMTAIDVMTDTDVLQKIKKSFEDDLKTRS